METSGTLMEFMDYSPATSNSATLAPPSPESEKQVTLTADDSMAEGGSAPQYAALGQISYAPATQTTVVTTTTTTTTSFPPLLLKAPRHLYDRDLNSYPLAASSTPEAIKNFSFDINGKPICFEETEDIDGSLLQFNQKYQAALRGHNGSLRSITNLETLYETPKKHTTTDLERKRMAQGFDALMSSKKRSASPPHGPPSLAEAAEIASLQRKHKKARPNHLTGNTPPVQQSRFAKSRLSQSIDESAFATPAPDSSHSKPPKSSQKLKRPTLKNQPMHRVSGEADLSTDNSRTQSLRSGRPSSRSEANPPQKRLENTSRPSLGDSFPPAASTTPPTVDDDFELFDQAMPTPEEISQRRPTPLDTLAAQDASLPSPSLSPITAAANLHNAGLGLQGMEGEDDGYDVSSLDIAQDNQWIRRRRDAQGRKQPRLDIGAAALADQSNNPQLPTPTLMDLPYMLDSFDAMPTELQTYIMYQMLRRCNKSTLQSVANVVNPALKCDFLALLPLELSMNIVRFLDVTAMCRAAQVSKRWRQIVDSDETAWKSLLEHDGLAIPKGEMSRAVKEGWGWQFPEDYIGGEKDLSVKYGARGELDQSSPASSSTVDSEYSAPVTVSRPKRKASSRGGPVKKRKTKPTPLSAKQQVAPWVQLLEKAQGPIAQANAAAIAIPDPDVGLSSLKNLHLYKSIYRRHHTIKKGWMEEETQPHHIAFRAHGRHVVTCLQFDSDKIITGSDDTRIHIYDTKTGKELKQLIGHEGGVWALQYDGNILVSGSTDRSVRVWDLEKGRCIQQFLGHTSTVRCLVILKPTKIGEDENGAPVMMPKEPLIITGSRDSSLRVWKLPAIGDRSIMQSGPNMHENDNPYFIRALTGHHHSVRAIAAHGDTLVSGSYDSSVRVWKISNGDLLHRLQGHTAKVYSVVLDHERNRCISGSMDNTVRVWSLDTGAQLFHLDGHTSLVGLLDLGFERLVSAAADSTLRIWDPETGHCKNTLSAHTGAITCFQHDDQKVISGSDRTLKLWNVKTGECVKDLLTDLSGVWQVKFNERRCVAAVQRDNLTYIEVLDFGAARDGVPLAQRGSRIVVDRNGEEAEDSSSDSEPANAL